jgi:hypothetical protein
MHCFPMQLESHEEEEEQGADSEDGHHTDGGDQIDAGLEAGDELKNDKKKN